MSTELEPHGLTDWPPARCHCDALVSAVAWSVSPLICRPPSEDVSGRIAEIVRLDTRQRRATTLELLLKATPPVELPIVRTIIGSFGWPASMDLEGLAVVAFDEVAALRRAVLADQLVRGTPSTRRTALEQLNELERVS